MQGFDNDEKVTIHANLGDQLRRYAQSQPQKTSIVYYDSSNNREELTYQDINNCVNYYAKEFQKYNLAKQTVICIMSNNTADYIAIMYACLKLGLVLTGINLRFTDEEIIDHVNFCEVSVFIADEDYQDRISAIFGKFVAKPVLIGIPNTSGKININSEWDNLELYDRGNVYAEPLCEVDRDDVAFLLYSSGSEAKAKVMLASHGGYLNGLVSSALLKGRYHSNEVFLLTTPFYTSGSIYSIILLSQMGGTLVILKDPQPKLILQAIEREKVSYFLHTLTVYLKLIENEAFEKTDISSLKTCVIFGGSPTIEVLEKFRKKSQDMVWGTGWGQSEMLGGGSMGFFRDLHDIPEENLSWIGSLFPSVEVKLLDESGNESNIGEAYYKAAHSFLGYYKNEELNKKTFRDGWIRSGDILRVNEDKQYFFVDRGKDMVKSGGFNVSTQEVENIINRHPNVARSAVLGVPDRRWQEKVIAVVELKSKDSISDCELCKYCKEHLAGYKVPKNVYFVENIPVDSAGKVRKKELKARYAQL